MKQLLTIITAGTTLLAMACNGAQEKPATADNTDSIHVAAAGVQVATGMFEAFNRHDWPAMAAFYSDSALFLDPSLGKNYVTRTRQQVVAKYKEMGEMFVDIKDEVKAMYTSGDHVTVEFVSSGSSAQTGAWVLPICTVLTIKDGKIIKDATYYDQE